jgi:hypothetical protein
MSLWAFVPGASTWTSSALLPVFGFLPSPCLPCLLDAPPTTSNRNRILKSPATLRGDLPILSSIDHNGQQRTVQGFSNRKGLA